LVKTRWGNLSPTTTEGRFTERGQRQNHVEFVKANKGKADQSDGGNECGGPRRVLWRPREGRSQQAIHRGNLGTTDSKKTNCSVLPLRLPKEKTPEAVAYRKDVCQKDGLKRQ